MWSGRRLALSTGAGALAVGLSFLLRNYAGGTYLPEMAAQTLFSLIPGSLESQAVENLGALAKESAFVGASILNVLLLSIIFQAVRRAESWFSRKYTRIVALVAVPYFVMLALGLVFLSIAQVSSQPQTWAGLAVSLVAPSLVFGAVAGYPSLATPQAPICVPEPNERRRFSKKRRLFIKTTIGAAIAAIILYYGVGLLFPKQKASITSSETDGILAAKVTPNDRFYRVDVNVIPPAVDARGWSLNLHGLVSSPVKISYEQLLSLPSVEEYATLECVSNKVGGDLMSTALWKGVRLRDILDSAGVSPEAEYVVFRCYDGYDVGVPLDRSLVEGTILAYRMNGEVLPAEHGYPLRAIVPGLYGMMNAKWITEIELVNQVYLGFWQRRGWTNTAHYQTASTIVSPGNSPLRDKFPIPPAVSEVAGSPIPVVGVAFAGDRGITKVEVSTDGGNSWENASLYDPQSKYTWVFWKLEWNPPTSGGYKLMVRATDGTGQTQTATLRDPFSDGATGYQVVDIRVEISS